MSVFQLSPLRRSGVSGASGASGGEKLTIAYEKLLDDGRLSADDAQRAALEQLAELADQLEFFQSRKTGFGAVFSRRQKAPKGLYIFGDVGRGKTLLMDLFFAQVNMVGKRRVHFHQFMDEVHNSIALIRANEAARQATRAYPVLIESKPGSKSLFCRVSEPKNRTHFFWKRSNAKTDKNFDPVALVAAPIIKQASLLCFDEFHVNDITNAMLLGRLFEKFFAAGMVVVATSNVAPDDLYKNGLNRELFMPFVELLKSRCNVLHLETTKDYRLDKLSDQPIFFFGKPEKVRGQMDRLWRDLVSGQPETSSEIKLLGRTIKVQRTLRGMARFEFDQLCNRPLGARDYLAVSHAFHLLVIDDVPQFFTANSNEAKRFILLVDTLYDQGVKLAASFACSLDELSLDPDTAFEFRRCVSRLKEMASNAYLAAKKPKI